MSLWIVGLATKKGIAFRLLMALMVPGLLLISACGKGASLAEPLSSPLTSPAPAPLGATPTPAPPTPPSPTPVALSRGKARPVMGVEIRGLETKGKVIPFENGQRLSLTDGLSLEVFLVPYSSSYATDLHLFPLRGGTPVRGAQVVATSEMTDMGHGPSDPQIGKEVEDGDYGLPLDLPMFGRWVVEVSIGHPEFDASLRLLLLVYPWRGEWKGE